MHKLMPLRYGSAKKKALAKYAYQSMQKGLAKDKKWLTRFLSLPSVSIRPYSETYSMQDIDDDDEIEEALLDTFYMKAPYIERLLQTIDVFNSKFGDDWDVIITYRDSSFVISFIHIYKQVIIANSYGHTHTIRDLVTLFSWYMSDSRSETYCLEMSGTRISLTPPELYANYQHSHLSPRSVVTEDININFFDTHYFCLGDEEISSLFDAINVEDFDTERLELLLYAIDQYVAWESIEGGPFRKMEEIVGKKKTAFDLEEASYEAGRKLEYIATSTPLDLDFYLLQSLYSQALLK